MLAFRPLKPFTHYDNTTTVLPVCFRVSGECDTVLSQAAMNMRSQLIAASVHDLLEKLQQCVAIEPYIRCSRMRDELRRIGIPVRIGPMQHEWEECEHALVGMTIAADAPTIPLGYLRVACEAIINGQASWVQGHTRHGRWYLIGWGNGAGRIVLPEWYRLGEAGGIARTHRDLQCGCHAPATAQVLERYEMNERIQNMASRKRRGAGILHFAS